MIHTASGRTKLIKPMDPINKFFLPPCKPSSLPPELQYSGERPTLHLLRRDLQELYLSEQESDPGKLMGHKAPYLSSMGILTGIDLMSKFWDAPTESKGKNRKRKINKDVFVGFLTKIGELADNDAQFLWEFRNALHHSYSLAVRSAKDIVFTTEISSGPWQTKKGEKHIVNLWGLKSLFLKLIRKYKDKLSSSDSDLKERFYAHYREAGAIFVLGQLKSQQSIIQVL